MKAFLVEYYDEEWSDIYGIEQLKEFAYERVRIGLENYDENEENWSLFQPDELIPVEEMTEKQAIYLLIKDGYHVSTKDIH